MKKIQTNFFCKSNHWPKRMIKIKKIVSKVLRNKNLGFKKNNNYFLNLIFLNDKAIKKINKTYRKKNKATDVLTFVNFIKKNNEVYCDIFFSAETIKKDAKKNYINFYNHITHLIIHCFLHVNGYDHQNIYSFKKMRELEEKILMNLDIKSPYLL